MLQWFLRFAEFSLVYFEILEVGIIGISVWLIMLISTQVMESTLALKPGADVPRSPKKDWCPPKSFF